MGEVKNPAMWENEQMEDREQRQQMLELIGRAANDLLQELEQNGEFTAISPRTSLEIVATASNEDLNGAARLIAEEMGTGERQNFAVVDEHGAPTDNYRNSLLLLADLQARANKFLREHPVDKAPVEHDLARLSWEFHKFAENTGSPDFPEPVIRRIALASDEDLNRIARRIATEKVLALDTAAKFEPTPEVGGVEAVPPTRLEFDQETYMDRLGYYHQLRALANDRLKLIPPKEKLN